MTTMEESEFIAHALRDFLRPIVGEKEVRFMDFAVNSGEPVSAIITGLGIAQHFKIWLPPIFEEKITTKKISFVIIIHQLHRKSSLDRTDVYH